MISQRKLEKELLKLVLGQELLNGSVVSYNFNLTHLQNKDHAHPTFVAGHPFKGSWVLSTGYLLNPEMARFQI